MQDATGKSGHRGDAVLGGGWSDAELNALTQPYLQVVRRGEGRVVKVWPNAGDQFERLWQEIFGRCAFGWTSCAACPADCGVCASVGVEVCPM